MEKQEPRKATIKPGWTLPEPPMCKCGKQAIPTAHHTGDGWVMGYACDEHGPDSFWWENNRGGKGDPYDWPFIEDYVWYYDWEAVGIDVQ